MEENYILKIGDGPTIDGTLKELQAFYQIENVTNIGELIAFIRVLENEEITLVEDINEKQHFSAYQLVLEEIERNQDLFSKELYPHLNCEENENGWCTFCNYDYSLCENSKCPHCTNA